MKMNKRLKVFFISNTSEFFTNFLSNHIKKISSKHNVFIICNNANNLKKKNSKNVFFINVNFKRNLNIFYDIKALIEVFFYFLKIRPNISFSFTPKVGLIVAISSFLARSSNRMHWFTGQFWVHKKGLVKIFGKLFDKLIVFLSHKVLIDGHSQKKYLIKENIITNKKSFVLYRGSVGGVDTKRFKYDKKKRYFHRKKYSISNDTFVFLYLGRINNEKGVIELKKAFNKIKNDYDILLVIVGPVEDKNLYYLSNNEKKILYFGYTKKPEDWFNFADILCLPSHREGFGNVIIEAASCGIPTLCSNIFGLRDTIINNKTGFFHKIGSVDDIKKKMEFLIKNKKLVNKCGSLARKKIHQHFDQNLISDELLRFINLNAK